MIAGALLLLAASAAFQLAPEPAPPPPPVPTVRATTNLADWLSRSWYPPEAMRAGEEGIVRFEVDVRRNGHVGACRITASSGSNALDEATCAIMVERARFEPARDVAGNRVADTFAARIEWALPEPLPEPADHARARANIASYFNDADYPAEALRRGHQGRVQVSLDVSEEGRVVYCNVTQSSGSDLLDLRTCQVILARARFEPARDTAGNPVPDRVRTRIVWRIPGG